MRLDKLLGQAGYGSRNQVKKLIRSRQVYVDGILAERDNLNVDASLQTITVSGKELEHAPEVYYLMNKPSGVVSARRDKEHQTVIDLIKPEDQRDGLYPVMFLGLMHLHFLNPVLSLRMVLFVNQLSWKF